MRKLISLALDDTDQLRSQREAAEAEDSIS
jgi:hypothetical protein